MRKEGKNKKFGVSIANFDREIINIQTRNFEVLDPKINYKINQIKSEKEITMFIKTKAALAIKETLNPTVDAEVDRHIDEKTVPFRYDFS